MAICYFNQWYMRNITKTRKRSFYREKVKRKESRKFWFFDWIIDLFPSDVSVEWRKPRESLVFLSTPLWWPKVIFILSDCWSSCLEAVYTTWQRPRRQKSSLCIRERSVLRICVWNPLRRRRLRKRRSRRPSLSAMCSKHQLLCSSSMSFRSFSSFFIILIFLDVPFFEPFLYASFYRYNTELGPPFRILVDTNFINWSIKNKIDMIQGMMDCLLAKCIPYVTDCVIAELEKFGTKYRVALRLAKDPRIERLPCSHKGTYADDCIVERVRVVFITLVCAKSLESLLYRCYLW